MEEKKIAGIFLADDHPLVIEGIKGLLADNDKLLVIGQANSGLAAFEAIKEAANTIDLLLSDIDMEPGNGIDLCKQVKKSFPHIQVIMLSVHSSSTMVKGAIAAEADGYLLKNVGKEELLTAINRVIDGGTYYAQEIIPIIYAQYQKEKEADTKMANLTSREREILSLLLKEFTSEEIGEQLFISKRTVETHRTNLLEKTGCKSTIGLVKYAFHLGLA